VLLIELDDVFGYLGIHYAERLGGIDVDKIGHVLSLANKRLPSACEVLQGRLPFAGKKHFCWRIEVENQVRLRIKGGQAPAVQPFAERLILNDIVEGKIEEEMPIVQNYIAPHLIAPGQQLPIPFLCQAMRQTRCGPQLASRFAFAVLHGLKRCALRFGGI